MLRRPLSLGVLAALTLSAPAAGHGRSALFPTVKAAAGGAHAAQRVERRVRRIETSLLGGEHAAAHADQRALERRQLHRRRDDTTPLAVDNSFVSPAVGGRWDENHANLPIVAINTVLLRTGKVLFFAYPYRPFTYNPAASGPTTDQGYADAYVFDPATGQSKQVTPPVDPKTGKPVELFCAGASTLPDGRVLVVGGDVGDVTQQPNHGLNAIYVFDPVSETWSEGPKMRQGRWYPSQLELPDGRTVIVAGLPNTGDPDDADAIKANTDVEIYSPDGTLQRLENFKLDGKNGHPPYIGQYPHLWWMPSGHALVAGPLKSDSWLLRPPTAGKDDASWTDLEDLPGIYREWAGGALLAGTAAGGSTKAMLFGGSDRNERNVTPNAKYTADASTVVFDDQTGKWSAGPAMSTPRAFANAVTLPDGKVAIVGGGTGDDPSNWNYRWHYDAAQKRIDIFDPVAKTFTYGNAQAEGRTYHSTALLLPDGRVMSSGDDVNGPGGPGTGVATDTAEFWSPPYLFDADGSPALRPALTSAPVAVDYGKPFVAGTPDDTTRAVLVAPGADTHATDMSQRIVELAAPVKTDGGVALVAPGSANLAPPGFYMLFLLNAQGVPSTARFVQIGADPPPPSEPTPSPTPVPTTTATATPTATPQPTAFTFTLKVSKTTLARVRRTGRLTVRVTPNRAASVRLRVGLGKRRLVQRSLGFSGNVARTARLTLSRKARKRLKGRKRATLVLGARGVPTSGAPRTVTRRVKLR